MDSASTRRRALDCPSRVVVVESEPPAAQHPFDRWDMKWLHQVVVARAPWNVKEDIEAREENRFFMWDHASAAPFDSVFDFQLALQ